MTDVIRRKIDRSGPTQTEGAPGADRGWRLALARAARDAMGLDLDFRRLAVTRASLAEILEIAPDHALVALLDGPGGGLGVLMFAPPVTACLIEMQTLGRLQVQPAPARKPTRIDAAMVAGVIDRALVGLDEALTDEADLTWAGGFRYGSYLEDVRPLGLLLEEEAYRVLAGEVALGRGDRLGEVILILPAIGRGERPAVLSSRSEDAAPQFTAALAARVLQADCRLDAVVGRVTLPIRQIMAWKVGDLVEMSQAAIDAVSLETLEGRRVALARLGQNRGMRALKILSAESLGKPSTSSRPAATPASAETAGSPGPQQDWRAAG